MNSKILIPIVGIHSAGKSTVRKELNKLGYVTEEECAELLRVDKGITAGAGADRTFEELVKKAEVERDATRKWSSNMVIVESWHILTLAYMLTRGNHIFSLKEYFEYVNNQKKFYNIHCIILRSDPKKILDRSRKLHSEADIDQYYDFYQELERNILIVIKFLGFSYKQFDTMKPVNKTIDEVSNFVYILKGDIV